MITTLYLLIRLYLQVYVKMFFCVCVLTAGEQIVQSNVVGSYVTFSICTLALILSLMIMKE